MPTKKIFDVFQPGLNRGSERLPFDPEKAYAYVEHPTEGWRVYLRSAVFVHEAGAATFNCNRFVVVKKTGAPYSAATWEPPKGQMEGKDMRSDKSIMDLLEENVRRETEEEAHITEFTSLRHTGIVFQATEEDFPPNWYFQYHIFQGFVTAPALKVGYDWFEWATAHPKAFARMRRDRKEKDAIDWYSGRKTPLNPRWCRGIATLYFRKACA